MQPRGAGGLSSRVACAAILWSAASWFACGSGEGLSPGNDGGGQPGKEASADQNAARDLLSAADGAFDSETGGLGSPCDVLTDAGATASVFNSQALECSSRICLKPAVQPGGSGTVNTGAYCATACNQDSDCAGQDRDATNPLDTRCSTGFLCGVAFVKGPLCCMRLCMCKDFLGPAGAPTPVACQGDTAATCE